MISNVKYALAVAACSVAFNASAAYEGFSTKIDLLVSDGINYGFCMARITTPIAGSLPGCVTDYVSFGCKADPIIGLEKATVLRNWEAAQLAYVTGKDAYIIVDSDRTYNEEYCVVTSIYNTDVD